MSKRRTRLISKISDNFYLYGSQNLHGNLANVEENAEVIYAISFSKELARQNPSRQLHVQS